jgi:hypothetical protein
MPKTAEVHTGCGCGCGGGADPPVGALVALERPRWFGRQIVGPDDLTSEQEYLRARARRHNRMLHGWGVVCGLRVRRGEAPFEVLVEAGYALDPCGEEIVVADTVSLDASSEEIDGAAVSPCGGDPWCGGVRVARDPEQAYYLAIRHVERLSRPIPAYGDGCGAEPVCEYSRRYDGYELRVLDTLPEGHDDIPAMADIAAAYTCQRGARECPSCPDTAWVVLADLRIRDGDVTVECFPHRRYAVSFVHASFGCEQSRTIEPAGVRSGGVFLSDPSNVSGNLNVSAGVTVRLQSGGMRMLPATFEVHAGETFADLIAREGGRVYVADTGERFSLAEAYAVAGVDPAETLRGTTDALRPLEALELRTDDLQVTRRALEQLVDDAGLKRLADEHADAPTRVLDLPATDLMGISESGALAGRLGERTIGEIAASTREEFVATAASGTRGAARNRLRAQADEVWATADRVRRIALVWRQG